MRCYLKPRNGIWYIYQYDERTGQCSRTSTGTRHRDIADKRLANFILQAPQREALSDATLIHVLLRYWEHHGKGVFSTGPIRRVMGLIVKHEPQTRLYDWTIPRQKEFATRIGCKPGTLRRYMNVMRAAVQWSFDNGEIPTMPAILRVETQDGNGVAAFGRDELGRLFEAATSQHERLFLLVAIATAARPNAALRLTWDRIKEGVADLNEPGRRRTKKRYGMVPVAPLAACYLEAHRSIGPVVQWAGKPLKGHKMTFARIARRAGVTGTAYGIRKAVAIWLRQEGVPEADIKGLLGHSMGGMTERYAHYRPEYMRAAADAIERLLREICPGWLASYLPAVQPEQAQVLEVIGGPYRTRTYDQFLKRGVLDMPFQQLKASNDD